MRRQSHQATGVVLLVLAVMAALWVQFLGGGFVNVIDAHETRPEPDGTGGGFVVSMVLSLKLSALIPFALGAAGIAFLFIRRHEQRDR